MAVATGEEMKEGKKGYVPYEECMQENSWAAWIIKGGFYKYRWRVLRVGHISLGGLALGRIVVAVLLITILALMAYLMRDKDESSGGLATFAMSITMATVPKNSILNILFGLPFERALQWHKMLAIFSLMLGYFHGFVAVGGMKKWDGHHLTGLILVIAMHLMVATSFYKIRRHLYDWFYKIHMFLLLAVFVLALLHGAGGAFVFGGGLVAIDWLIRGIIKYRLRKNSRTVHLSTIAPGLLKLSFDRGIFNYASGQYMFIVIPDISILESHPFSFSSSPYQKTVTFHIKVLGDWTKRLEQLSSPEGKDVSVWMHGPYGAPGVDLHNHKYSQVALISGGIGVTPMNSVAN